MPAILMTKTWVESNKACAIDGKRTNWTDIKTTGLVLRVSPPSRKFKEGIKTWALSYNRISDGKKRFYTIGRFSEFGWTLSKARQEASKLMADIKDPKIMADPQGDKQTRKQSDTFRELGLEWVEVYGKVNKTTWKEDLRYLKADVFPVFGDMKAHEIKKREIVRLLEEKAKTAPKAANRLRSALHTLFEWALATDRLEGLQINPVSRIPKYPEMKRTSFLETDEEIKIYWETVKNSGMSDQAKDILKIALLTGQRSGEPRRTRQSDVNLGNKVWTIRKEIAKTKKTDRNAKDHHLPMSPAVYRIFKNAMKRSADAEYVFASPVTGNPLGESTLSRAWSRARQGTGLEHVNVHDMRRTLRTDLGRLRISSDTKDRITNHKKQGGSSGDTFYEGWKYLPEMREALEAWENHVMGIVEGREIPENVVALRG